MITDNNRMCWHALHTAPKSEHRLMQCLNAAGYTTFCPTRTVSVKWKGKTKEVTAPLFSGCLFVVGDIVEITSLVSDRKAVLIADKEGRSLSIKADKAELPGKFLQLFR